jgi:intracellular septation protein
MTDAKTKEINPVLEGILEYGPIIGFFVAYRIWKDAVFVIGGVDYSGFVVVTGGFVIALLITSAITWSLTRTLSRVQILTLVPVVIFGGLTVWLNDPAFIKRKPTIIYLVFAGILGAGLWRKTSLLTYAFKPKSIAKMNLSEEGWLILTRRMMYCFLGLAVANEAVAELMSEAAWVNFKTFGLPILIMGFMMTQGKLFETHALVPEDKADAPHS